MIKLLIGGSPCTHWSIAQTKHRETTASGLGWELFKNYLIAKEKFQPDFFLYENNKSASQAIRDQISAELGVSLMYINSSLVSAQNRQRFYAFNWEVEQPKDRNIHLKDILETNVEETFYALSTPRPINETESGKSYAIKAQYAKTALANNIGGEHYPASGVATPIRIGTIENEAQNSEHDSKQYRVYSPDRKATTLCGQGGGIGAKTGLYATPINTTAEGKAFCLRGTAWKDGTRNLIGNERDRKSGVAIPLLRVNEATKQGFAEIPAGECVDLSMPNSKTRRGRAMKVKSNCLTTSCGLYQYCGTLHAPIYEVKNGHIEFGEKKYPIQLKDGFYIIRKLTVTECCRLQTLPDTYCKAVSNSQAYKGLGNGWTAEVIIHILRGALNNIDRNEKIVCLSMYDGIGTGRYCLNQLGFTDVEYYAYEIDKYAMRIANDNFGDIVQLGDAFNLRNSEWDIEKIRRNNT